MCVELLLKKSEVDGGGEGVVLTVEQRLMGGGLYCLRMPTWVDVQVAWCEAWLPMVVGSLGSKRTYGFQVIRVRLNELNYDAHRSSTVDSPYFRRVSA